MWWYENCQFYGLKSAVLLDKSLKTLEILNLSLAKKNKIV